MIISVIPQAVLGYVAFASQLLLNMLFPLAFFSWTMKGIFKECLDTRDPFGVQFKLQTFRLFFFFGSKHLRILFAPNCFLICSFASLFPTTDIILGSELARKLCVPLAI